MDAEKRVIIGLTGLHGAGKSHLAELFATLFGWNWIQKNTWLKEQYIESFNHRKTNITDWHEWRYQLYDELRPSGVMNMVLSAHESMTGVLILDSIHNPEEWQAVTEFNPTAILVGVFAPLSTRMTRKPSDSLQRDSRRVKYWHQWQGIKLTCLLTEVEWAFTGHCAHELLVEECKSFCDYLNHM